MTTLRALLLCTFCYWTFLLPAAAQAADVQPALVQLSIGTINIRVELASTPKTRARGLMRRNALCPDCGMLFVFGEAAKQEFWMKETLLPLSIAFIAEDGRILNIEEMPPKSAVRYGSHGAALYALEMNSGWFMRHGIKPGDRVQKLQGLRPYR